MQSEYPTGDNEFTDYTIENVEGSKEEGWSLTIDDSMVFGIPGDSPVVPKVGMVMRQYGRGFGFIVRGCFIDGRKVYYRTDDEQRAHDAEQVRLHEQSRRDQFEKDRADLDRRYEALPPIFRARLDKFRKNNPDFRWKFEGYELFTCEQAVVFAETFKTPEALIEWSKKDYQDQRAACPGMDDGHSGNTFGMACRLAHDYLTTPENVQKRHGALAPLVGSEEYGCVARTDSPRP